MPNSAAAWPTSWISALTLRNDGPGRQGDYDNLATGPQRTLIADAGLIAPHWPRPWGVDATPAPAAHHRRGVRQSARPGPAFPGHRRVDPADADQRGARSTSREVHSADAARRTRLVPAVQRARRRFRPRVADDPGDQGRRRLADQRPQDLDLVGAHRRLRCAAGPHRSRRRQASRPRLLHRRHAAPKALSCSLSGRRPVKRTSTRCSSPTSSSPTKC